MRINKILNPLLILLIFHISVFECLAQEDYSIIGAVSNQKGESLKNINVIVYNYENEILAYSKSDIQGKFYVSIDLDKQPYYITISGVGYTDFTLDIDSDINQKTTIKIGTIVLEDKFEIIEEIIIKGINPIKIVKDTTTIKVDKFRKVNDRSVEDLLKNIPGISITEQGDIAVNGKEISKILIEGRDIFNTEYKIPSKGIDAEDLESIDIIENFNENTVLNKFTRTDDIAININFKKNRKNKFYGNSTGIIGLPEKIGNNTTLFKLNKEVSFFNVSKINNYGDFGKDLLRSQNNHLSQIEKLNNSDNLTVDSNIKSSYLFKNNTAFNSANFHTSINEKLNVRFINTISYDKLRNSNKRNESFLTGLVNDEINSQTTTPFSINNNINFIYSNNDKLYVNLDAQYDLNKNKKTISQILNNEGNNQLINIESNFANLNLLTTFKIRDSIAIVSNTYFSSNISPLKYSIDEAIFNNLLRYEQNSELKVIKYGTTVNLKNKNNEISISVDREENFLNTDAAPIKNELLIDDFENRLSFKQNSINVVKGWRLNLFKKINFRINTKLGFRQIKTQEFNNISKRFNTPLFATTISTQRNTKRLGKFTILFNIKNNTSDILDFHSKPILVNSTDFNIGTNEILNSISQRFQISHSKSDIRKQIFYSSSFSYIINNKSFENNFLLDENVTFNTKGIGKGNEIGSANLKVDQVFLKLKSAISLDYIFLYRRNNFSLNDNIASFSKSYTNKPKITWASIFDGYFNFLLSANMDNTMINFNSISRNTTNFNSNIKLIYSNKKNLSFTLDSRQLYPNSNNNVSKIYNLINFNSKYLIDSKGIEIYLDAQNIGNVKEIIQRFINPISTLETNVDLIPIFITAGLKLRF